MPMNATSTQLVVSNDYDVVAMRQDVRQQARTLGLGLIQQAKLATAISAVARALLAIQQSTTFTMQTTTRGIRPALEIECVATIHPSSADATEMEQTFHMHEARLLVDETDIILQQNKAHLTLRVWLSS